MGGDASVQATHLIIVCCHAIYLGSPQGDNSEDNWSATRTLPGAPDIYQIPTQGIGIGPKWSVDLFRNFVKDNHYFQDPTNTPAIDPSRILSETHATDSYQNVLFSLLRFRLHTGVYPQRVTVVTHEFKRARFMECHFPAVGLLPLPGSLQRLNCEVFVEGINPPEEVTPLESLASGEASKGIGLWKQDLYGTKADLAGKRVKRGWYPGMEESVFPNAEFEDVVGELLRWDGEVGNEWFPRLKELPWAY
ncbi:hypothetical protein N7492_006652 [Penicillium capsulatum]|uniref:DUF218 domain-containing protein n=1 Tax=Penicillium capsulatum TaxID=69766 RepID=A0A9W9I3B0_9EURO|nr:hypothetical protein N7492_006652 [Penicillium capsulatum]KAJ6116487.1 hypothetical protein N7512_006212 [Penicillium capsulatum]